MSNLKRKLTFISLILTISLAVSFQLVFASVKAIDLFDEQTLEGNLIISEDFENATITTVGNKKQISENIYSDSKVDMSIVNGVGNKALKFMYLEEVSDDERALVIKKTNLTPFSNYFVSFYAKKATNIFVNCEIRSGLPSNNYNEHRVFSTAFNDAFSENSEDKGAYICQIIPSDPWGNLIISLNLKKWIPEDKNLGLLIDDIKVTPYQAIPTGKVNLLNQSDMVAIWNEPDWNYNDNNPATHDWQLSVGSGLNGWWGGGPYCVSDQFNTFLATNDETPVSISQKVTLKPNTKYNFSLYTRKHGVGQLAEDELNVMLKNDTYTSKVSFTPAQIGQDAFEQYVKIGGTLQTGEGTEYYFYIEHKAANPMSWRGFQLDEAYLYEADNFEFKPLEDASKSENVSVVDDIYSGIIGSKVLQADISAQDAKIVYELDVAENKTYKAFVDAQKVSGADGEFNCVKPMDIEVSINTGSDGSGTLLNKMTDYNKVSKAIETFEIVFNSQANTKIYLTVKVKAKVSVDNFVANNNLINFKNFYLKEYEINTITAGGDQILKLKEVKSLTVKALSDDNISYDISSLANVTASNDNILVDRNTLIANKLGDCILTISYLNKTTSINVSIIDNILSIDAGADRNISLNESENLIVIADYETTEEKNVTDESSVEIEDGTIVEYSNGIFTAKKVGSTLVTVSFEDKNDTFTITVPKELVSIEAGENRVLPIGQILTVKIVATYNDDTTIEITEGLVLSSSSNNVSIIGNIVTAENVGASEITVAYGGMTDKFTISVSRTVKEISAGGDRDIKLGEKRDLTVTATYEDDTTENVTGSSEVLITDKTVISYDNNGKFTALRVGSTTITVNFGDKTVTFVITVPKELLVITTLSNQILNKGATINVSVIANYNDETSIDVTVDATITSNNIFVAVEGSVLTAVDSGESIITVAYEDKTATFTITVPKTIERIEMGDNLSLKIGESATVQVSAIYSDGEKKIITALLSSSTQAVIVNGNIITANKIGSSVITAKYGDKTATITVTVSNEIVEIKAILDQNIILNGNYIVSTVIKYSDGSEQTVIGVITGDNDNVSIEGNVVSAKKVGTSVITVTYNGFSTTFTVNITNPILKITVNVISKKLYVGNELILEVVATYADNTTATVDYTVSATDGVSIDGKKLTLEKAGKTTLTIKVGDITETIVVDIVAKKTGCGSKSVGMAMSLVTILGAALFIGKKA